MRSNDQTGNGRKKKVLWLLPLLILPFVTLFFWAMGGGTATTMGIPANKGFNLKLPSAKVSDDSVLDKLHYYDRAAIDSSKVEELRKKDPNYRYDSLQLAADSIHGQQRGRLFLSSFQTPQEKKVYERLEAL